MKKFEIWILGEEWSVVVCNEDDDKRLKDCSGFTDWTMKRIVVLNGLGTGNLGDSMTYMRKVVRHEIVHAFMFVSGLADDWCHQEMGHDETVVDWIAIQVHKMSRTCAEAERKLGKLMEESTDDRTDTWD